MIEDIYVQLYSDRMGDCTMWTASSNASRCLKMRRVSAPHFSFPHAPATFLSRVNNTHTFFFFFPSVINKSFEVRKLRRRAGAGADRASFQLPAVSLLTHDYSQFSYITFACHVGEVQRDATDALGDSFPKPCPTVTFDRSKNRGIVAAWLRA